MRSIALSLAILFAAMAGLVPAASATEPCGDYFNRKKDFLNTASAAELKTEYGTAAGSTDCDRAFLVNLGRKAATAIANEVDAALRAGGLPADQVAALEDSLHYYRLWQVLATLGDIARDGDDPETATRRYQEALEVIDDRQMTAAAPPEMVIRDIYKKAETQRLLATRYVPAPKNRAGVPTGLGSGSVRGVVMVTTAIPVTFKFDSTEFTDEGMKAADDLFAQLKAKQEPAITLIGHTDPKGTDAYNMELSDRRAAAVRDFLVSKGYSGAITVEGRGEREPFVPDDPTRYDEAQRHQMCRRVELVQ